MAATMADRPRMPLAWRRLAWFIGIWAAGVVSLGIVSYGLRALIGV